MCACMRACVCVSVKIDGGSVFVCVCVKRQIVGMKLGPCSSLCFCIVVTNTYVWHGGEGVDGGVCMCVCVCVTSPKDGGVEATRSLDDSNFGAISCGSGAFAAAGLSSTHTGHTLEPAV